MKEVYKPANPVRKVASELCILKCSPKRKIRTRLTSLSHVKTVGDSFLRHETTDATQASYPNHGMICRNKSWDNEHHEKGHVRCVGRHRQTKAITGWHIIVARRKN